VKNTIVSKLAKVLAFPVRAVRAPAAPGLLAAAA
jgi:hypothetical protein